MQNDSNEMTRKETRKMKPSLSGIYMVTLGLGVFAYASWQWWSGTLPTMKDLVLQSLIALFCLMAGAWSIRRVKKGL